MFKRFLLVISFIGIFSYLIFSSPFSSPFSSDKICPYHFGKEVKTKESEKYYKLLKSEYPSKTVLKYIHEGKFLLAEKYIDFLIESQAVEESGIWALERIYGIIFEESFRNFFFKSQLEKWSKISQHHSLDILNALHHLIVAWDFRGGEWAYKVTKEGWKGFDKHIDLAYKELIKAYEKKPNDPHIYASMFRVLLGYEDKSRSEEESFLYWFEKANELAPYYRGLVGNISYYLQPRWSGSKEGYFKYKKFIKNNKRKGNKFAALLEITSEEYLLYDKLSLSKTLKNNLYKKELKVLESYKEKYPYSCRPYFLIGQIKSDNDELSPDKLFSSFVEFTKLPNNHQNYHFYLEYALAYQDLAKKQKKIVNRTTKNTKPKEARKLKFLKEIVYFFKNLFSTTVDLNKKELNKSELYRESIRYFKKAYDLIPMTRALTEQLESYYRLGEYDEVIELGTKLFNDGEQGGSRYLQLVYDKQKKYPELIEVSLKSQKVFSKFRKNFNASYLMTAYFETKEYAKSMEQFDLFYAKNMSDEYIYYYKLANTILFKQKKYKKVVSIFSKIDKKKHEKLYFAVLLQTSYAYNRLRNFKKSIILLNEYKKSGKKLPPDYQSMYNYMLSTRR